METIKSEVLEEGIRFSSPVFFDDGKNMFLAEKKPLTNFHLNVLSRWKVPYVITYGRQLGAEEGSDSCEAEELEELEALESDSFLFSDIVRRKLADVSLWKFYSKTVKNIQKVYAAYNDNEVVDKVLIDESVKLIYRLISDDKEFALSCVFCKFEKNSFYPIKALDTAILSAVLGLELSLAQRTVIHCITAALLHELEAARLSAMAADNELNVPEKELLLSVPQKTAQFALHVLMYPRDVVRIVLQHREYWNGAGYPEGRKGQDIDICARILAVCDAFYVMVTQKPEGQGLLVYDAVKKLLDEKEKKFDPVVLKAFVRSVGLYPAGTFVLLNDSSIAQVTRNNPAAPFVPSVQIIYSASKDADKTGQLIDLNVQKSAFIVRAVSPEDKNLVR